MILLGSKAIMDRVNAGLKSKIISRASVINFLEAMREAGVLKGVEKTGKGGYHWIYSPSMNEAEFKQYIARTILESLMRSFPEETKTTIKASMG
jgi:predicted transcriptional regulator